MSKTRAFIAVEIAPSVRARATELIKKLSAVEANVGWAKPDSMHLTLKYLGDVPDNELYEVCKAVNESVRGHEPFELVYRGLGAFPSLERPRTIWLGVDQGAEEVIALQASVDEAFMKLGFPRESRRFQPHLTLGRVRGDVSGETELLALLEQYADYDGDLSIVEEVVAFASYQEKEGVIHESFGHAELAG